MKKILLWPFMVVGFFFFYLYEVVMANFRVAHDIITPCHMFKDTLVKVKAPIKNRIQMVVLMNLVTMTPGTVAVDYNVANSEMTVHFMFADEVPEFERKLIKIYIPFIKAVF